MISLIGLGLLTVLFAIREYQHDKTLTTLIGDHQAQTSALIEAHAFQVGALVGQTAQEHQKVTESLGQAHPDLEVMIGLVERLCQRVQAPEQAIVDHTIAQPVDLPSHVPVDDDVAYWDRKGTEDLTTEQLAEMSMAAELDR